MRKLFCQWTGGHLLRPLFQFQFGETLFSLKRCRKCAEISVGMRHAPVPTVSPETLAGLKRMAEDPSLASLKIDGRKVAGLVEKRRSR